MLSAGQRFRDGFENMTGQIGWFQPVQNVSGPGGLIGCSMSDHQILTRLYSSFVSHDAVFWYTQAVQTGANRTQTADYHRVLQASDDPCRQWTANQHRAY